MTFAKDHPVTDARTARTPSREARTAGRDEEPIPPDCPSWHTDSSYPLNDGPARVPEARGTGPADLGRRRRPRGDAGLPVRGAERTPHAHADRIALAYRRTTPAHRCRLDGVRTELGG